jgi:hypothetical protein
MKGPRDMLGLRPLWRLRGQSNVPTPRHCILLRICAHPLAFPLRMCGGAIPASPAHRQP